MMLGSGKCVTLRNGSRVLMRSFNNEDQMDVVRFFQRIQREDIHYLTFFSANLRLNSFLSHSIHSQNGLLLALEIDLNRIIGAVFFSRRQGASSHMGKVHCIYIARPFQKMGLGTMLLDECIRSMRLGQQLETLPVKMSKYPCGAPRLGGEGDCLLSSSSERKM